MSEWRDRGYVPDSDDDEIVLDSPDTPHPTRQRQASVEISHEHGDTRSPNEGVLPGRVHTATEPPPSLATESQEDEKNGNQEQDATIQDAGNTLSQEIGDESLASRSEPLDQRNNNQDAAIAKGQDAPSQHALKPLDTPRRIEATLSKGQPIVLITQTRRANSPPEPSDKNVRTYSRKFKPTASRRATSIAPANATPSTRDAEQPQEKDVDFMDIDALVGPGDQGEETLRSAQPLSTSTLTGRRFSVSSSDLSDVDEQIVSSSQPLFAPTSARNPSSAAISSIQRQSVAPNPDTNLLEALPDRDLADLAAPRRNLRTRKAIQLHPYLIEIEQYRRSLKARGLRPVHVATNSQQQRDQDDSQDAEFREESQPQHRHLSHTQETTPPDSSASSLHDQPQRSDLRNIIADGDDEFPDIDAAIRRHVIGGVQEGFKRRRTLETPHAGRGPQTLPSSTSGAREKLKSLNLTRRRSGTGGTVNQELLPPSPPRTSSPSNAEPVSAAPPRFRLPRGLSPVTVPTPLPSSSERPAPTSVRRPRQVVISSDEDDADRDGAESDQSSPENSDLDERQLKRMRRKIRGVLPASWLKLDRQTRQPPPPSTAVAESHNDTPRATTAVRGVAQRRAISSSATPARQNSYVIFSDNSGSDASLEELPAPHLIQTRLPSPITRRPSVSRLDTAEVEEHDEIDHMFPSTGRPHFRLPGSKKRQPRLTDTFTGGASRSNKPRPDPVRSTSGPSATRKSSSNVKSSSKTKRKPKAKKPTQLSILDAAITTTSPQAAPRPQFVRLAARQARKRPDHGRHSPTHKDIRLATREDTQEALEPLRSWRAGNISRSWNPPAPRAARSSGSVGAASPSRPPEPTDAREARSVNAPTTQNPQRPRPSLIARPTQSKRLHQRDSDRGKRNVPNKTKSNQLRILERNHRMRPAQLETVGQVDNRDLDMLTFAPPPSRLMEIFSRDRGEQKAFQFRLQRFLQDKGDVPAVETSDQPQNQDVNMTGTAAPAIRQRKRKGLARRFDVETARFRQPDEPLPAEVPSVVTTDPEETPAAVETLQGLGSFGTRYPADFDVRPLEIGTYFSASTFVGSGDFADSLTLRKRDLDVSAGRITIEVAGHSLHWSAWNEDVSAGLGAITTACTEDLHAVGEFEGDEARRNAIEDATARFNYFLRSVVRYLSGCLHFLDPIDRPSSLSRVARFVDEFVDMIEAETVVLKSDSKLKVQVDRLLVDSLLFLVCVTTQCVRISQHPAVDSRTQATLVEKAVWLSRRIVAVALPGRFTTIREFLEEHRQHARRDSGIQEHYVAVKSVVIVSHVLKAIDASCSLSDILTSHLGHSIGKMCNIHAFDQIWYDVFSVQPLLEIDTQGIYRPRSRFHSANDNWNLVKSLLQRMFDLYPATSQARSPTLNDYVRACLVRVYHLVVRWGWHRCETALSTIYDFFAKNHLSQLHREEGKGSPKFLEDLDKNATIELDVGDCAFHIFLKLLVVGLRGLQDIYPKNKFRSFAWRFIPNHGRTYRKDQELTHVALDALRNHHDLLCTLYWVLPSGSGPRLQMIKDLVDHDNSHREACRLSVHAWGILARYKLSQGEQFGDSDFLAFWFKDMIAVTISQYRLARSEAEAHFVLERSKGSIDISPEMLETTIAANQRSIFATLQDLLLSIRQAVRVSKSWASVRNVFELSSVLEVLKFFDIDQPRLSVAIVQTLDGVGELLDIRSKLCKCVQRESQPGSDDSQDYGDWSFMDQVVEQEPETSNQRDSEVLFLQEPTAGLLSTCFGSEKSPDDELLKKIVDVWTLTAAQLVKDDTHDWSSFLDAYSTLSWFQLRETEQRHKYTCYFLSSVIKSDKTSLESHRALFIKAWFISLLERESMLKFQHMLTASLLEKATTEPLLHNLPFAANPQTGQYHITLTDLRQRRVSLVGSILANMHASLESAAYSRPSSLPELRREYVDLLKHAMQHMRRTYEELQDMSSRLGSTHLGVRGAYVTFVQQIISLMQQYTSDICPIDSFFVDSSAFPLPADDPTYVIARLKSYVPKLADSRARKQLAVFLQTVSERAALDNQQPYLVSQVHQALTSKASRSLRQVIMTAMLPAYISCAMSSSCGWVLAMPFVEASALVFEDLIYELDIEDGNAVDADVASITSLLRTTHDWITALTLEPQALLHSPGHLRLCAAVFGLVESTLTIVDYIHRATNNAADALTLTASFVELGDYFTTLFTLSDEPDAAFSPDFPVLSPHQCSWPDTLDFSTRNLQDALSRSWHLRDGTVMVARGNNYRQVDTGLQTVGEEKMRCVAGIEMFMRSYNAVCGAVGGECEDDDVVDAMAGLGGLGGDGLGWM